MFLCSILHLTWSNSLLSPVSLLSTDMGILLDWNYFIFRTIQKCLWIHPLTVQPFQLSHCYWNWFLAFVDFSLLTCSLFFSSGFMSIIYLPDKQIWILQFSCLTPFLSLYFHHSTLPILGSLPSPSILAASIILIMFEREGKNYSII